jgi:hypothetical protein
MSATVAIFEQHVQYGTNILGHHNGSAMSYTLKMKILLEQFHMQCLKFIPQHIRITKVIKSHSNIKISHSSSE